MHHDYTNYYFHCVRRPRRRVLVIEDLCDCLDNFMINAIFTGSEPFTRLKYINLGLDDHSDVVIRHICVQRRFGNIVFVGLL